MFCPECGKENNKASKFCEFCGAKMEEENKKTEKAKTKNNTIPKKPIDKKKKIIIGIVVAVLAVVIVVLSCLSGNFKPNKIAKDYFLAVVNQDVDALYKYAGVDNSGLTSKKILKKVYDEDKIKLENYSVQSSNISSDGLSATVTINYTLEGSSNSSTTNIYLVKDKHNKFLIFDNWKISGGSSIVNQDYEIKVPKGSVVKIEGIKVNKKWLSKNKDSEKDTYVIPKIFKGEYDAVVTLKNGLSLKGEFDVGDSKSSDLTDLEISDKMKKELEKVLPQKIQTLYQAAIDKKSFNDIKSNYNYKGADLKEIEKAYNKFKDNVSSSLKKMNITAIEIEESKVNNNGDLELEVDIEYEYTKEYAFFSGTDTGRDERTITVVLDYVDNDYKVINISSSYFSWY